MSYLSADTLASAEALRFLSRHPPGGATALLAVTLPNVYNLSWFYLGDITAASCIMLAWALLVNNIGNRRYPGAAELAVSYVPDTDCDVSLLDSGTCQEGSTEWLKGARRQPLSDQWPSSISPYVPVAFDIRQGQTSDWRRIVNIVWFSLQARASAFLVMVPAAATAARLAMALVLADFQQSPLVTEVFIYSNSTSLCRHCPPTCSSTCLSSRFSQVVRIAEYVARLAAGLLATIAGRGGTTDSTTEAGDQAPFHALVA